MFEDSFLDSFMESHIGGWTGDEDRIYDEQEENWWADREADDADEYDSDYCDDDREDFHADEAIGYVDPFEDGPFLD